MPLSGEVWVYTTRVEKVGKTEKKNRKIGKYRNSVGKRKIKIEEATIPASTVRSM